MPKTVEDARVVRADVGCSCEDRSGGVVVKLARIALWTGAVVDALAALQLLLPTTFVVGSFSGLRVLGGEGSQLALESAALLLGWSVIEVWAAQRPDERQVVMFVGLGVLTVFLVQNLWLLTSGRANTAATLPILVLQVCLVVLFVAGILAVRRSERIDEIGQHT